MSDPRKFGFQEIWCVDFEFAGTPGSLPMPHTLVSHEVYTGRTLRLFEEEFTQLKAPPYGGGPRCAVRGLLRQRGTRMPPRARLASSRICP